MKEFLNAFKVAALFIGTVIGAGFATGRELSLFFAGSGVITVALSAALMGGFCFVFLFLGSKGAKTPSVIKKAINFIIAISAFFVYAAMLSAAEELVRGYFGLPLASVILGILSAMFCRSIEALKKVNALLIPLLIAAVVLIAVKAPASNIAGSFRPFHAVGYCTMNMLFASALIRESGKNMRVKYMALSGAITAVGMFLLMFVMLGVILPYKAFSMPFLLLACAAGLGSIGVAVILIAIFTTIIGCNKLIAEELNLIIKNRFISLAAVLGLGMLLSLAGFMRIVNNVYPLISALGIAICAYSLIQLAAQNKNCFRTLS